MVIARSRSSRVRFVCMILHVQHIYYLILDGCGFDMLCKSRSRVEYLSPIPKARLTKVLLQS